jgi:predicted ATP-grasp superfamily ATP-dependent carboligase
MNKPSVVIIGNHTQGLGIIRSASNYGIPVYVLNDLVISSSRYSRYVKGYYKLSRNTISNLALSPVNEELTNLLLSLPVSFPSVLMGINEDIINYISANSKTLAAKYFIPENKYHLVFDKYEFNNLLPGKNKVPTFLLKDFDLRQNNKDEYILKSRRGNKLRNITKEKALLLNGNNAAVENLIVKNFENDELIVQKLIKTKEPVQSSCAFSIEGEVYGLFQYKKIRQHPNQFGTGTYLKSIYNEILFEGASDIIRKLKYTGISEIEFILDEEVNDYKVIEMNPRTWKSINFSTQCGQNLVEKLIDYTLGKKILKDLNYRTDLYWVDIFTDIPQMLREKKLFTYNIKNLFECSWDRKDPLPFISTILFSPLIYFKV